MNVKIIPNGLNGNIIAPLSKSNAHRVLVASALCKDPTEITLSYVSDDIHATIRCLKAMGANISILDKAHLCVEPIPVHKISSPVVLNCGESGTTLRLLLPIVSALGADAMFTASGRLPERPLRELVTALTENGCHLSASKPPFTLNGKLTPGDYKLLGNVSSQYISGLLYALVLLDGRSRIIITTKLESASYVEMTLHTLKNFGIYVDKTEAGYFIEGRQQYVSPESVAIEGDWSNAAFFLAAGALSGKVAVAGLSPVSLQGDRAICDLLKKFGADVHIEGSKVTVCEGELHGIDIDVSDVPDLFPVLAVVASVANGTTRLMNAARLRIKESDRIHSVAIMLNKIGAEVLEQPDSLIIYGKPYLTGGTIDSWNDHRIVMAAAVASVFCREPVTIKGAEAVAKSYLQFFDNFNAIGGNASVINAGQEN